MEYLVYITLPIPTKCFVTVFLFNWIGFGWHDGNIYWFPKESSKDIFCSEKNINCAAWSYHTFYILPWECVWMWILTDKTSTLCANALGQGSYILQATHVSILFRSKNKIIGKEIVLFLSYSQAIQFANYFPYDKIQKLLEIYTHTWIILNSNNYLISL